MTEQLLIPIAEAARMLGCCRDTIYNMEKRNQIRLVRPFKRTMVPKSELERIARGEPLQEPVGEPVGEPKPVRVKKRPLFPQLSDA